MNVFRNGLWQLCEEMMVGGAKRKAGRKIRRVLKSFRKEIMIAWTRMEMIDMMKNYMTQDTVCELS